MKKNMEEKLFAEKKLQKIRKFVSAEILYSKIKYKNMLYSLGDNVIIRTDFDYYIAKIIRIIPINGIMKYRYWPTIEIKQYHFLFREKIFIVYFSHVCFFNYNSKFNLINFYNSYYKKNEINRDKNGLLDDEKFDSLSEKELFQSEHKDIIAIENISAKCKVRK